MMSGLMSAIVQVAAVPISGTVSSPRIIRARDSSFESDAEGNGRLTSSPAYFVLPTMTCPFTTVPAPAHLWLGQ